MGRMVPDETYLKSKRGTYSFCRSRKCAGSVPLRKTQVLFRGGISAARFLVIAAPRPSGSPDLELIQAGPTGGRFFCRAPGAGDAELLSCQASKPEAFQADGSETGLFEKR